VLGLAITAIVAEPAFIAAKPDIKRYLISAKQKRGLDKLQSPRFFKPFPYQSLIPARSRFSSPMIVQIPSGASAPSIVVTLLRWPSWKTVIS